MVQNKFSDFIVLDPDLHWPNFVDPHHWYIEDLRGEEKKGKGAQKVFLTFLFKT